MKIISGCSIKKFDFYLTEDGRIGIENSTDRSFKKRGIYIFFQKDKKQCCYVGKTERAFSKRLNEHLGSINRALDSTPSIKDRVAKNLLSEFNEEEPSSKSGKEKKIASLYQKIRSNPKLFSVALVPYHSYKKLRSEETKLIKTEKTKEAGYNGNKGGGGGVLLNPKEEEADVSEEDMRTTPKKHYPIKEGKVLWTPTSIDRDAKGVIYTIFDTNTKERYVGSTITKLVTRMSKHFSDSRRLDSCKHPSKFMDALSKKTGHFSVGILYKVPTKKLKLIREIEDLFAMFAKEKYPLLNSKRPSLKGLWKPR